MKLSVRNLTIGIPINWPIKVLARTKMFKGVGSIPVLQYIIAQLRNCVIVYGVLNEVQLFGVQARQLITINANGWPCK